MKIDLSVLCLKLGSIAVHAEELLSPDGREADRMAIQGLLDRMAIQGLLADPEVRAFLDDPDNAVLLPVKRKRMR